MHQLEVFPDYVGDSPYVLEACTCLLRPSLCFILEPNSSGIPRAWALSSFRTQWNGDPESHSSAALT